MAAVLTALMILLFLGNWRLTLIILASIPLSIITAVLALYLGGQTLNTMTLGGFALAVGILVDNGTVVIENIERHTAGRMPAGRHYKRRRRSRRPHLPVDVIHLYGFRADLPASGDRKISVFAAFAVGLPFADREPGAVLHTRPGPVQLSDDFDVRGAQRVRPAFDAGLRSAASFDGHPSRLRAGIPFLS